MITYEQYLREASATDPAAAQFQALAGHINLNAITNKNQLFALTGFLGDFAKATGGDFRQAAPPQALDPILKNTKYSALKLKAPQMAQAQQTAAQATPAVGTPTGTPAGQAPAPQAGQAQAAPAMAR